MTQEDRRSALLAVCRQTPVIHQEGRPGAGQTAHIKRHIAGLLMSSALHQYFASYFDPRTIATLKASTEGRNTCYISRTLNSKEYIRFSSRLQKKLFQFWSDFGTIVEYTPSITALLLCIPCRNIFLVQYFRQWYTPRIKLCLIRAQRYRKFKPKAICFGF